MVEIKQSSATCLKQQQLTSSSSCKSSNSLTKCVSNMLHMGFCMKRSETEQGSTIIRKDTKQPQTLINHLESYELNPAISSKGAPSSILPVSTSTSTSATPLLPQQQTTTAASVAVVDNNDHYDHDDSDHHSHLHHNAHINNSMLRRRRNTVFHPHTTTQHHHMISGGSTNGRIHAASGSVGVGGKEEHSPISPTTAGQLLHYSRRLSVDHATMGNILGRIMFVEEKQIMFLNFENLKIESMKHLENIASCIRMLATNSMDSKRKDGHHLEGKIKCFLNDDDLDCDAHLFDTYTQTVHMNPLFESVTRYTNKSLLSDHQRRIQKSLKECEVYVKTCPCILDRYVFMVDDQIGKGTYGTVSVAMDLSLGRKVAVKRLCKKTVKLIGIEEYVRNEMEIMKLLKENPHDNIVQVLDIHESEAEYLFVMEYLAGGCLENPYDECETVSEQQAQSYFCQLVHAIDHLHSQLKVLHRDIQASNCCFLDQEKRCLKLVDFGLSCQPKDFTKKEHTLFCGNSNYACPELLLKKAYGSEVDVYALGVLLYKMLFGCFPFRGAQQKLLMSFTVPLDGRVDSIHGDESQHVSASCKDLLQNILEVNCEKRFTLQDVKNHEWFRNGSFQSMMINP